MEQKNRAMQPRKNRQHGNISNAYWGQKQTGDPAFCFMVFDMLPPSKHNQPIPNEQMQAQKKQGIYPYNHTLIQEQGEPFYTQRFLPNHHYALGLQPVATLAFTAKEWAAFQEGIILATRSNNGNNSIDWEFKLGHDWEFEFGQINKTSQIPRKHCLRIANWLNNAKARVKSAIQNHWQHFPNSHWESVNWFWTGLTSPRVGQEPAQYDRQLAKYGLKMLKDFTELLKKAAKTDNNTERVLIIV